MAGIDKNGIELYKQRFGHKLFGRVDVDELSSLQNTHTTTELLCFRDAMSYVEKRYLQFFGNPEKENRECFMGNTCR